MYGIKTHTYAHMNCESKCSLGETLPVVISYLLGLRLQTSYRGSES